MPEYLEWFVNREKQYLGFQKMLAGKTPKKVMLVEAPAEMGKTWVIQRMHHYAGENNVPAMYVDFRDRRAHDYLSLVRRARDQMDPRYFNHLTATINNFTHVNIALSRGSGSGSVSISEVSGSASIQAQDVAGRDIIKDNQFYIQADSEMAQRTAEIQISDAFFSCLATLLEEKGRAVFLFDSYEDVTAEADRWLREYLLLRMSEGQLPNTIVVIAGRKTPDLGPAYQQHVARTGLDLFTEEQVREYILDRRKITGLDLGTIFKTSGGFPGLLAKMADVAVMDDPEDDDWL